MPTAPILADITVDGRAVKGPADRMLMRLAGGTTPAHVASCYEGLIDTLVIHRVGPLKPGATTEAVWKLNAVKTGSFKLFYEIGAGLSGTAKAEVPAPGDTGTEAGGSFAARITSLSERPSSPASAASALVLST